MKFMKEPMPAEKGLERRQHLRYNVELRLQLIGSGMLPLHIRTNDISLIGMHFDCDRITAQHLMPPGETAVPANARPFTVRFKIPAADNLHKTLTVVAEVIGVQRIAQDRYRANMRFVRFGGDSQAILESYLSELTPAV